MLENLFQNTGVIIEQRPTDWLTAGFSGIVYEEVNPSGQWGEWLPSDETQLGLYVDTFACVTFSALNVLETALNFKLAKGTISPETVQAMRDLGYLVGDKFNFSDRFTAKMSGTTRVGNTAQNVWDSIRKDGLLPEADWAFPSTRRDPPFTWEDYYAEIPQELKDKAKKFLDYLKPNYEWVSLNAQQTPVDEIKQALKQSPLQIYSPTCSPWNTSELIPTCGIRQSSHATIIYGYEDGKRLFDFDHYNPYRKQLAWDYPVLYVLKGVIEEIKLTLTPKEPKTIPQKTMDILKEIETRKYKVPVVQDSEQSGAFGIIKNGVIEVATPERLPAMIATFLAENFGTGLTAEVWNNAPKKKF